jgi:hypothetical protein
MATDKAFYSSGIQETSLERTMSAGSLRKTACSGMTLAELTPSLIPASIISREESAVTS